MRQGAKPGGHGSRGTTARSPRGTLELPWIATRRPDEIIAHVLVPNSVRYKFCMRVLRVLRVPKQGLWAGGSPILGAFLGSPRAHFLVSTWVERPHCLLPPPQ